MGWVTIRIALAHLLPGFFPTMFFFVVMRDVIRQDLLGTTGEFITVYILISIALGITIDIMRHKFEKIFINWVNFTWIKYLFYLFVSKIKKKPTRYFPLKRSYQNYDEKEKTSIKLWLSLQLKKHDEINEHIKSNPILEKEYIKPTITSGDRWALLNILERDSMRFMMEEYFSYYEFSFNSMLTIILAEIINLFFYFTNRLTCESFWIITSVCLILIVLFHELTIFWLLSTKRFARKLILFSLLK